MSRWPLALGALVLVGCAHSETAPKQPTGSEETAEGETPPSGTAATPLAPPSGAAATPAGQPVAMAPPRPRPVKIKIIVRSNPPKANVFWGKKNLGPTPVTLERPRDSGPVDLVLRNDGYFPVHTRAYTFRNDAILVRLTKLEERMSLFGAKREATEPVDGAPEGEPAAGGAAATPPASPPPAAPPQ